MQNLSTSADSRWAFRSASSAHEFIDKIRDQGADDEYLSAGSEARPMIENTNRIVDTSWRAIHTPSLLEKFLTLFRTTQLLATRQHERFSDNSTMESGKESSYTGSRRGALGKTTLTVVVLLLALCGITSITLAVSGLLIIVQPSEEPFLPHWGEPGHMGERIARYPTDLTRDVIPIPCHSHNDYWRRVPLYEAIHNGLVSVEADVWLVQNDLLVGHKESSLTRQRTFRSMYIDPITAILEHQNPSTEFSNNTRNGVFDTDPERTLILLVDLKTDGYETLPVVQEQLQVLRSKGYLTYFDGHEVVRGQVTVVATGNAPFDMLMSNSSYRDIFFDAPLDLIWRDSDQHDGQLSRKTTPYIRRSFQGHVQDQDQGQGQGQGQGQTGIENTYSAAVFNATNSYYASVSFSDVFGWPQLRPMSRKQIEILQSQIKAAHRQGLMVRYWDTPAWPVGLRNNIWRTLVEEGVDILNVDDLNAAAHGDWRTW